MANPEDLSRSCCLNPECRLRGRRNALDLPAVDRYGKAKHRLLYCRACKDRFSEFKATPPFNSRLPHEKVLAILEHLAEGCGVRQAGRLVGVNKDTVTRLALRAGSHARSTHDELEALSPRTREVQLDEKWDFVAKKQAPCDPVDPADGQKGDYCDHVAYDPEHRSVLAVAPGARSIENAEAIVAEAHRRVDPAVPLLITSDEYPAYRSAIEHAFGEPVPAPRRPGRPRIVPESRVPERVVYATVHKQREGHGVVAVERRPIFGTEAALAAPLERSQVDSGVNTSFLERQNGADRGRDARKVRRSSRFGKQYRVPEAMTCLTTYGYNFCWVVRPLRLKEGSG